MPLNWNVEKVADQETLCWVTDDKGHEQVNPVTQALVFLTMNIGINSITDKNVDEVILRVTSTEALTGARLNRWEPGMEHPEPRPLTADEIRAHVGLATNASTLTHTQWRKNTAALSESLNKTKASH